MHKKVVFVAFLLSILLISSFITAADYAREPQVKLSLWQRIISFFSRETPQESPSPKPAQPQIKVCTKQDLENVKNNLAGNYVQVCDIDLTGYNFQPIGIWGNGKGDFTGSYNGQNYKIKGFNYTNESNPGALFIRNKGLIKNVHLVNSYIGSSGYTLVQINLGEIRDSSSSGIVRNGGGLVAENSGTIENSSFEGSINNTGMGGGGLVGDNGGFFGPGLVNNSYFKGSFTCHGGDCEMMGGLVGENYVGTISLSYSQGTISGGSKVGGLVGNNAREGLVDRSYSIVKVNGSRFNTGGLVGINVGNISKSFAAGSRVNGDERTGGLVGMNTIGGNIIDSYSAQKAVFGSSSIGGLSGTDGWENEKASINNSYSYSYVDNIPTSGGLIGYKGVNAIVLNSYWDNQTSAQDNSEGGEGKTTTQMKQKATYKNWDFANIWTIREGRTYPYFMWQRFETELLMYYEFNSINDGKTFDTSVYHQDGLVSGAKLIDGYGLKSLSFSGKDYIVASDIDIDREFTVGTWIKLDKLTQDTGQPTQIIASKALAGKTWGPYAMRINNESKPEFIFYPQNANQNSVNVTATKPLALNNWTSVVAKLENNELSLYINGDLDKKVSANGKFPYETDDLLHIGAVAKDDGTRQNFLNGALDEMQIYSRALSDQEIQSMYK